MKKKVNLKVQNTQKMLEILEKLGTLNANLDAEGRLGSVSLTVYGNSKKEIRKTLEKLQGLIK